MAAAEVAPAPPNPPTPPLSESALAFLALLRPPQPDLSPAGLATRLDELRRLTLLNSCPKAPHESAIIRPLLWKLFLRLNVVPNDHHDEVVHPLLDAEQYYHLVSKEPSPMFNKIKNDTFRTLATDREFKEKVGEEQLVRCLEAFVWRQLEWTMHAPYSAPPIDPGTPYVQGLNVLAAPFLFVLPSQIEAYACFCSFIESQAPRYVRPTLEGVHAGLHLVDLCLASLDPTLYTHLLKSHLTAELYAFPSLLTFCAGTPPLEEVLELWDFLLAWGVGLNVLCVVAQLWLMRMELLESTSPMKLLRTFPPLKAKEIIPLAVQFVADLKPDLYDAVVRHPWDDSLVLQS
ncbi:cell cycle arrest protein BUB2 [Pseudohyphozyma bogoriensis]|nr:cell cycle arrest protein BUB2 [Pseudohyphozyma bogoriensis]